MDAEGKPTIAGTGELHRAVGRIEGKVDAILDRMDAGDRRHARLEKRVGSVERRVHWYSGALAVIAAAFAYVTRSGSAA